MACDISKGVNMSLSILNSFFKCSGMYVIVFLLYFALYVNWRYVGQKEIGRRSL